MQAGNDLPIDDPQAMIPHLMKAVLLKGHGGPEQLEYREDVPVPSPAAGEVLMRVGAAAINNLMEDAATAEISRAQVWQWVRHGVHTKEGQPISRGLVQRVQQEELAKLREAWGPDLVAKSKLGEASRIFEEVALAQDFPEFLTLPAYESLP